MNNNQNNNKKRHFNIVDVGVIAIIIAIAGVAVWKISTAKKPVNTEIKENSAKEKFETSDHLRYTVVCTGALSSAVDEIENCKNHRIFDNSKSFDAYITDYTVSPTETYVTGENGEKYTVTNPNTKTVTFTVDAAYNGELVSSDGMFEVDKQEIRVGAYYNIKTKDYQFSGVISKIEVIPHE